MSETLASLAQNARVHNFLIALTPFWFFHRNTSTITSITVHGACSLCSACVQCNFAHCTPLETAHEMIPFMLANKYTWSQLPNAAHSTHTHTAHIEFKINPMFICRYDPLSIRRRTKKITLECRTNRWVSDEYPLVSPDLGAVSMEN